MRQQTLDQFTREHQRAGAARPRNVQAHDIPVDVHNRSAALVRIDAEIVLQRAGKSTGTVAEICTHLGRGVDTTKLCHFRTTRQRYRDVFHLTGRCLDIELHNVPGSLGSDDFHQFVGVVHLHAINGKHDIHVPHPSLVTRFARHHLHDEYSFALGVFAQGQAGKSLVGFVQISCRHAEHSDGNRVLIDARGSQHRPHRDFRLIPDDGLEVVALHFQQGEVIGFKPVHHLGSDVPAIHETAFNRALAEFTRFGDDIAISRDHGTQGNLLATSEHGDR